MRQYVNYFQSSIKLTEITRHGLAVIKPYSSPATLCDRTLRHDAVSIEAKTTLSERRATLDAVALLHTISEGQSAPASIVSSELGSNPRVERLARFLSRLPDRWLKEQEIIGRKSSASPRRTWRVRKGPFKGVWCNVLGWLEEDLDDRAVSLLERLQQAEPERFSRVHLSTPKRRVQKWRSIMASKLVCPGSEGIAQNNTRDLPRLTLSMDDLES